MKIEAHAKVNLTLEVFGARPDGYHALRSLVVPISLSDTLHVEPSDVLSSDTGYPDDLILKAARALDPGLLRRRGGRRGEDPRISRASRPDRGRYAAGSILTNSRRGTDKL